MAKLNWFLTLKNMAKSDTTAKELLDEINNADSEESKAKAKETAKEYVESMAEPEPVVEPIPEPDHVEPVSEVEIAEKELAEPDSVEIETETEEETGERPEPLPPADNKLIERIRRRKQIAEENAKKRRSQTGMTLSEQKEWAIQRGKEVMARNALMAERRKELHDIIEKQKAERAANNERNMVGLQVLLLREIRNRKRLELICKENKISRADLDKLKQVNPNGWQELLNERSFLEKEIDMYIK